MTTATPTITADMRARAQQSKQDVKSIDTAFKDAAAKLREAMEKNDLRLIQSTRRVAEVQVQAASHLIGFTDLTITRLRAVEDAAEGDTAELREAAKTIAEQTAISAAAAKMFQVGKALMAAADEKIVALAKSGDELDRKWAKGDAWIRMHCGERKDAVKTMAALYARAEKARDARDAKTLGAVQKEAQTAIKFGQTLTQVRQAVEKITAGVERDHVAPEMRKQIETDIDAWAKLMRCAEADEAQIGMDRGDLTAMSVEARDAKKAAQVLGMASGDAGKLAKALAMDGAAMEKALEALGKTLEPAQSGKDMLAALRRAKLV